MQKKYIKYMMGILCGLLLLTNMPRIYANPMGSFVAISDIHFDPFADCPNNPQPCPLVKQLQQHRASDWAGLFQQASSHRPSSYHHDTNYALLQLAAKQWRTHTPKALFVLIPGDFLAHDFIKKYKKYTHDNDLKYYIQFVNKTYLFLTILLKQTWPHTPIYPAIGNNDAYHGDYYSDPNGSFYQFLARKNLWQALIINKTNQAHFVSTFPIGGYYKVTPPQFGIIILYSY